MTKILGIDLGTTNSAMAIVEGGRPRIIENAEGGRTTPSVVAVSKAGERLVGLIAKRQAITNPENTVHGIKRFMGHRFNDPVIQKEKSAVSYDVAKGDGEGAKVRMGDAYYTPEEVSAMILQKMKRDAEAKLGEKITEAVITVPAYFDDSQRKATKVAGEVAGFTVHRILNEPTAAALAYGLDKKKNERIAVFDFGGGTFDITVLEVSGEVIEVKATDGDSHMGGEDIDRDIVAFIAGEFKKESGIDVSRDPLALQRLKEAAEKAKHELSETTESEINLPFITSDAAGPKHLVMRLSRAALERIAAPYIDKAVAITKRALEASKFQMDEIDEVILVGGQTRMPAIVAAVRALFGKEPNKSINPDEVVAAGAAIQAGIIQGDVKDILLLDVTPLSLGIETLGGVATKVIERNTTVPTARTQVFSTAADNQTSVEIHVMQGERPMAADNKTLGRFILDGIPPSPRGLPQIEVTFDIDANGILSVTAKDKASGKAQSIRIEASSNLPADEIERMKRDAEAHAADDERKKSFAEAKNAGETLAYTAEKALSENKARIPADVTASVEEKIGALRAALGGEDAEAVKTATSALSAAMQKIGEAVARGKSGSSPDSGTPPSPGTDTGPTRDADVEDENDAGGEKAP
ncbi:MAG: molecular chaperone DnaK [Parcubacteria group bacterium]|nr:molecular chaperone DnaK [Parcubacteria group bacterium]